MKNYNLIINCFSIVTFTFLFSINVYSQVDVINNTNCDMQVEIYDDPYVHGSGSACSYGVYISGIAYANTTTPLSASRTTYSIVWAASYPSNGGCNDGNWAYADPCTPASGSGSSSCCNDWDITITYNSPTVVVEIN